MRLTERDRAVLEHVARYRLTTAETLQGLFFSDASTDDAVKSLLRRLRRGGYLESAPLYGRRHYYHLTRRAALLFGLSPAVGTPAGIQAVRQRYGVLAFCCQGARRRQRFTREEFRAHFPDLARELSPGDYAIDTDPSGQDRMVNIRVDFGRETRSLVRKCFNLAAHFLSCRSVYAFADEDRFGLALVTADHHKRKVLSSALEEAAFPLWFTVESFPELAYLPYQDRGEKR